MSESTSVTIKESPKPDPAAATADTPTPAAAPPSAPEPQDTGDRPDWLPSQFKSPEDLVKSWREQQGMIRTREQGSKLPKLGKPDAPEGGPQTPTLNWDAFNQEYLEHGTLSEASRAAIRAASIPDALVDTHLQGLDARVELHNRRIADMAGGQDKWEQMVTWAQGNLPAEEIKMLEAHLAAVDDPARVQFGVERLANLHRSSPAGQNRIEGSTTKGRVAAFQNNEQMIAAMQDPRYAQDPAYREEVAQKVLAMRREQTAHR